MTLEDVRAALMSDAGNVLVEAPAGCGKTHEAAKLACELAARLPDGREVLLLAHTNAAVQEFRLRTGGAGGKVRATTIDAFCLDLLRPYATAIGLPSPLRRNVGQGAGRTPFAVLAPKADELLCRCPSVTQMVAARYPVIILDEHQDATLARHAVTRRIAAFSEVRVRVFGDPMQAIYGFGEDEGIPWPILEEDADVTVSLNTPQRWKDTPELGDWILESRSCLQAGLPIPISSRPSCVRINIVRGMPCVGNGKGNPRFISGPIHDFLNRNDGKAAVLTRTNMAARGHQEAVRRRLILNEGLDFDRAYRTIEKAAANVGRPRRLALVVLDLISKTCAGLTKQRSAALNKAFTKTGIDIGMNRILRPFIESFIPIYKTPDLSGFCRVVQSVIADKPTWLTIRMPEAFRLIGRLRPGEDANPLESLDQAVTLRKLFFHLPYRTVGTVHKAKGHEYDHVMIGNFSADHFPDTEDGHRLAYVALSRARKSIEIIVPERAPSPLLG